MCERGEERGRETERGRDLQRKTAAKCSKIPNSCPECVCHRREYSVSHTVSALAAPRASAALATAAPFRRHQNPPFCIYSIVNRTMEQLGAASLCLVQLQKEKALEVMLPPSHLGSAQAVVLCPETLSLPQFPQEQVLLFKKKPK